MGSSLTYQILLYLTGFYFGMFIILECGLLVFKGMYLPYDNSGLWVDGIILILLAVLETFRILEGQKGNLTSMQGKISLAVSLGLSIPSAIAVIYFAAWQNYVLRLEMILCIIQLSMQVLEFVIGVGVLVGR